MGDAKKAVEQTKALKEAYLAEGNLGGAIVAANLEKWAKEAAEEEAAAGDAAAD
jgi:hypothetical protein